MEFKWKKLFNLLTTHEAAWHIIQVVSVCQMITFKSLNVGSSYLHIRYISMKVNGSMSRPQKQKV